MNFFRKSLIKKSGLKKSRNFEFMFHSISLVGDRDENQDYSIQKSFADCHIMILADGMGGHSGGRFASEYFSENLIQSIEKNVTQIFQKPVKSIGELVMKSREKMLAKINSIDKTLDPNTTFVATVFFGDQLITAHLGDSRSQILSKGKVISITKDHSLAQLYVDQGILESDEIINHQGQSKLLKAIGKDVDCDPEIAVLDLKSDAFPIYILQMSDGFWQAISKNDMINEIIRLENNLDNFEEIIDNLANKAVRLTSPDADNTTIQVCRISM